MKTQKQLIPFFLLCGYLTLTCQTTYQVKDSTYIFWQEGTKINYKDYKGLSFPNRIPVIAEIGIWTVLDLPEKAEYNSNPVHFYIAPLFDRNMSHADSNDLSLLAVNNIYFDISELCARYARKKMTAVLLDTLGSSYLIASSAFKSIIKEMHEKRLRMNRQFYTDYFRLKNRKAINTWRARLNDELKITSNWATQPKDCYRFISRTPLEKGYVEDLSCNLRVLRDKYEQALAPDTWHAGFNQISRFRVK